jgi:hypothetical protein
MVPMTGQNAVLNAASLKRKTHVRTTIVQGENAPPIVDDEDRTMATVHNKPALRLQIVKAPSEREFLVRCVHKLSAVASFVPLRRLHRLPCDG